MNPMQLMLNKMINSTQVQQNPMAKNAVNMLQNEIGRASCRERV